MNLQTYLMIEHIVHSLNGQLKNEIHEDGFKKRAVKKAIKNRKQNKEIVWPGNLH